MNILKIENRKYTYEIDGKLCERPHSQAEFIIDGVGLGDSFSFEAARPWFGQTCFENTEEGLMQAVSELFGNVQPMNQFDSGRFVLYRCHCGCDYCGVISCIITRNEASISWEDIRYENDDLDDEPMYDHKIKSLEFCIKKYEAEIQEFIKIR